MSLISHEFKIETAYAEALKALKDLSGTARRIARLKAFKGFIDSLDDDYKGLRLYETDGMRVSEAAALVRLGVDPDGLAAGLVRDVMTAEKEVVSGYCLHLDEDEVHLRRLHFSTDLFVRGLISRYAMEQGFPGTTWPKREKVVQKGEKSIKIKVDDWLTDAYEDNLIRREDLTYGIESALVDGDGELVNWEYSRGELSFTFAPTEDGNEYFIAWNSTDWFTPCQSKELVSLGALRAPNMLPTPRRGDIARFLEYARPLAGYIPALSNLLWETALQMRDVERLHYLRGQNGVKAVLPQVDSRRIDLKFLKGMKQAGRPKISPPYEIPDLMDYLMGSGSEIDRSIIGELIESRLIDKPLTCSRGNFVTRYTDSLMIAMDRSDPGLIIEGTGADILDALYVSQQTLSSDMMRGDMVELHYLVMVADSGELDFRHLFKRAKHNLGVINSYTHSSLNRLAGSGKVIKLSDVVAKAKPIRDSSLREFATTLVRYGAKFRAEMSPCWCQVQLEREMKGRKEPRRNPSELVVDVPICAAGLRARGNVLTSEDSRYIVSQDNNAVLHIAADDQCRAGLQTDGEEKYLKGPLAGRM